MGKQDLKIFAKGIKEFQQLNWRMNWNEIILPILKELE
jgi:hypothetical protein